MPLSWNEIRNRAVTFSKEWENESSEDAEAKSFWDGFFNIFGISRKRVASFEEPVKQLGKTFGYIDLFWKGVLLVEHKSKGKDLDKAHSQALDYFKGIDEDDLPKYVLVSDFAHFRLYDMDTRTEHEFTLKELHKNIRLFGFIAGYQKVSIQEQPAVNIEAAERMGKLHDQMKAVGYEGHELEVYLVRLLFCLFAEDTGIYQRQQFQEFIINKTKVDGSDLAAQLEVLFHTLNTPEDKRLKNIDEDLQAFPYVNGRLFEERLPPAGFDSMMRKSLLHACAIDWSKISPAIFGALFQSIMDKKARRNLGAHYTSEGNIMKLIKTLFLDELHDDFNRIKGNKAQLKAFHQKLSTLTFFDPACGCGNFLVIAYRELRLLELEVLKAYKDSAQQITDVGLLTLIDVDQFYGIEIEEFPAQIAQVALWLMDHQMNMLVSDLYGDYYARIPLRKKPNIVCENALQLAWESVVPKQKLKYILGNPPFIGAKLLNEAQKKDLAHVFGSMKNAGVLDYVSAWYVKAAQFIENTSIRCAYVSTNSITQGEQVGVLWGWMLDHGIKINYAHRTFSWSNEAKGKAAVHCVIIGFAKADTANKWIFEYEDIKSEPHRIKAKNINPYLVDAANVVLPNRSKPICDVPEIGIGNKPIDGGHYLFTDDEKKEFLKAEPAAKKWFRRWMGSDEFINGYHRWCLWLGECPTYELKTMPECLKRVELVKKERLASKSEPTRKLAQTPTRFHVENIPDSNFLLIPKVSSEKRFYIPIGYMNPSTLCSDLVFIMENATLYHFGVLTSLMHNAWMRAVCGRLESRYRYSAGIVYNNFPWAKDVTPKQKKDIEDAAQGVLDARANHPQDTLADLYDASNTYKDMLKAHQRLDSAVDAAYGKKSFGSEAERVAFLFDLYQQYTSPLGLGKPAKKTKAK